MKKKFSIAGIVVGVLIILLGLYLAFGYSDYVFNGSSTYSYTFGADYYTEQYAATENAADNILALGNYLRYVIDFLFVAVGLLFSAMGGAVVCYFGCKLADVNEAVTASPAAEIQQESADEAPAEVQPEAPCETLPEE